MMRMGRPVMPAARPLLASLAMLALLSLWAAGGAEARSLRYAMKEEAQSLDPHFAHGEAAQVLIHMLYQGLTRLDETHRPRPLLALGWSAAEGSTLWRFYLREDVRFHDGRGLRADDVVFSVRRAAAESAPRAADLSHIAEISAQDERTVVVRTSRPDTLLPARLAWVPIMSRDWVVEQSRAHGVLSAESWDPTEAKTWHTDAAANGTGPYKLVSRHPGARTELVANPDYWRQRTDPRPLAFKSLIFLPLFDDRARLDALRRGAVDIVLDPPLGALEDDTFDRGAIRTARVERPESLLIGFDLRPGDHAWDDVSGANPFADVRVRQAVALSVDAEAMRKVFFAGGSLTSAMPVPPAVKGWSEELDPRPIPDLEKATALLADAGYPEGFSITLHCPDNGFPAIGATCRAMAAMLGQIGIETRTRSRPIERHLALLREGLSAFYLLPWTAAAYDSRQTLEALYHSEGGGYGAANHAGFSDELLDSMIETLSATSDRAEAARLLPEVWRQAMEPLVYVPLHHRADRWVSRRAFIVTPDGFGLPDFARADHLQPGAALEPDRPPATGP